MPNSSISGGVDVRQAISGALRQVSSIGGSVSVSSKSGRELRFMRRQDFPEYGSPTILYVDIDQNRIYRWIPERELYSLTSDTIDDVIRDDDIDTGTTWSSYKLDDVISTIEASLRTKAEVYTQTMAEWSASGNIRSRENVIYVYSDYRVQNGVNIPGIKIGDGSTLVNALPFITDWILNGLVTDAERTFWNNKVTAYMSASTTGRLVLSKD